MKTAEDRRRIKDRMAQTQLEMRHTIGCTVLPDRNAMLDHMPKGAHVAEIGVADGAFSAEILRRCAPKRLYLCDAWASERYRDGLGKVRENFADQIAAGQVEIRQGLSTEILPGFEPGSLDWVYIDTNHSYETTLAELTLCDGLVGPEGLIAGHDFCTGNVIDAVPYGVVEAVTAFCRSHRWQFHFLTVESRGHFSFCLRRLAA